MDDERRDKTRRGGIIVGVARYHGRGSVSPMGPHWGIFAGVLIALVGLVLLMDNMGFHIASHLFRFWPLILIIAGAWNLATQSGKLIGGILVLLGLIFLLDSLGIAHFSWGELWPIVIIGVGVLVMWSSLRARDISAATGGKPGESGANPRTTLNEVAIFGGVERRITTKDFRGGFVQAVFGGVELDLRDADMLEEEVKLEINAVFGGVELRVPEAWQVISRGQAIFGGFVDGTRNYQRPENLADVKKKALILTGAAIFGGVEIKN